MNFVNIFEQRRIPPVIQKIDTMLIAAAQTRPLKGDIDANIELHLELIDRAVKHGARVVIFPELSLTGYEPELAAALATTEDDSRFRLFQEASDRDQIVIGLGVPIRGEQGIYIGMLLFREHMPVQVYSKQFLHSDEEPFFIPGPGPVYLGVDDEKLAFGICYETSLPQHAKRASKDGATVYLASVLNYKAKIDINMEQMQEIAVRYGMPVFMANYVGDTGGYDCAGNSAAWNSHGELLKMLDAEEEGLVFADTTTGHSFTERFPVSQSSAIGKRR